MRKLKVMVVDDSALIRMIVGDMISQHDDLELIATAKDGLEAIEKLKSIHPDVITLDIEMPNMDGLDTLEIIQERYQIPVIMLSSLTERNSKYTLEALGKGAYDFIEKPSSSIALDRVRDELYEKIASVRYINQASDGQRKINQKVRSETEPRFHPSQHHFKAIAIGASTGGPKSLTEIIRRIPKNKYSIPIFVVQHMPKGFTKHFAERLDRLCYQKVKEAEDGETICNGTIYIAPGDYHMTIHGNLIRLDQRERYLGVRPAVDYLFQSAAETYGEGLLSILLTGMGRDGTEGMRATRRLKGVNIAQDEETSVIFGMPGSAIKSGVVDYVLSLEEISMQINKIIER